jgi:KDO2-lipid IV(A) lauroyltransferase
VSGLEHLERARASGAGIILCGIHAGSYSLIPFILGARGYQLIVLAKLLEEGHEAARQRIEEICQAEYRLDVTLVRGPMAVRQVVRRLKQQGMAVLLCDTHGDAADPAIAVNFLGRSFKATQGVGWLQQQTGASVLPVFLRWEERTAHHLTIMPPIVVDDSAPNRIKAVTAAVLEIAERQVQTDPAQWLKWKDFHEMVV